MEDKQFHLLNRARKNRYLKSLFTRKPATIKILTMADAQIWGQDFLSQAHCAQYRVKFKAEPALSMDGGAEISLGKRFSQARTVLTGEPAY